MIYMHSIGAEELLILSTVICYLNVRTFFGVKQVTVFGMYFIFLLWINNF
jgi:hypothetical protein